MQYRLLLNNLFFIVLMMGMQAIAYPRQAALKKLDHIVSLTITASSILFLGAGDCKGLENLSEIGMEGGMIMNMIINGLALKYDKSPKACLKFLLPSIGIMARVGDDWFAQNNQEHDCFEIAALSTLAVYWVKSIWDIRGLRSKGS